jgi:teichoic acid ribitol-phosphate primase
VSRLEFRLSSALLQALGWLFSWLPKHPHRVALVTARTATLEGNLRAIHDAIRARRPDLEIVLLLDPYGYGPMSKLRYLLRMVRGMYHVRTAGLVIVDNAYLPVHVAPHGAATTVVQVWHAAGALKRFGADATTPLTEPEQTFLHRHYDWVVTAGEASREPWAAALRTPVERVLALGTPRTDAFFDQDAMDAARTRVLGAYPALAGRRVVLYAPTFRGRGRDKRPTLALDAVRLRAALPDDHILVLKTHPNLDPGPMSTAGYDLVVDPVSEINDLLVVADVLVTDYSSSIFEYALLRRPIVLLVGDLDEYEADPGLYLDYRAEMIGALVDDTDGVIDAVIRGDVDPAAYDAFIARHLGACDGHASERLVDRFLGGEPS